MSPLETDLKPCVLLAFRAENVRSFRDEFGVSLIATAMADKDVTRSVPWREGGQPLNVLPAIGAFGANASGKSNLLRVMDDMRSLVLHSFHRPSVEYKDIRSLWIPGREPAPRLSKSISFSTGLGTSTDLPATIGSSPKSGRIDFPVDGRPSCSVDMDSKSR